MTNWTELTARAGVASHLLIGWIFWDPRAIANYEALGVPNGAGYYVASRGGPLAPAGADAVAAAFYSINPVFLKMALDLCAEHTDWESAMLARDEAVTVGLAEVDPSLPAAVGEFADRLWQTADSVSGAGRVLFAAHRERHRPDDPALSAWLAVNCLREWRGDTHWALCVTHDLGMVEVGILHNSFMGYEADWIPRSRGADDETLDSAWNRLTELGLAEDRTVNAAGRSLRDQIESRTDELSSVLWQTLGESVTVALCEVIEAHTDALTARIDATAGESWMPAIRSR